METKHQIIVIAVAALLTQACGEGIETRTAQQGISPEACELIRATDTELATVNALIAANGLPMNGLSMNVLSLNGIKLQGINLNGIKLQGLGFNGTKLQGVGFNGIKLQGMDLQGQKFNGATWQGAELGGIDASSPLADTELGRQFLHYAAGCALPAGESVTVAGTDGNVYAFDGALGLTPAWRTRPLDDSEQRWFSACMLAHVNAFGEHVPISVRAEDRIEVAFGEAEAYPLYEGAFFGDISAGRYYACTGTDAETALAMSAWREVRVCTDADDRCEIEVAGACADICETFIPGRGFLGCAADGIRYDEVVSVYLQSDAARYECGLD